LKVTRHAIRLFWSNSNVSLYQAAEKTFEHEGHRTEPLYEEGTRNVEEHSVQDISIFLSTSGSGSGSSIESNSSSISNDSSDSTRNFSEQSGQRTVPE